MYPPNLSHFVSNGKEYYPKKKKNFLKCLEKFELKNLSSFQKCALQNIWSKYILDCLDRPSALSKASSHSLRACALLMATFFSVKKYELRKSRTSLSKEECYDVNVELLKNILRFRGKNTLVG